MRIHPCNCSLSYQDFLILLPENMYFLCITQKEHSYRVLHFIKNFLRDKMIINPISFSKVRQSGGVTGPENRKYITPISFY